jgi:hypothetical protein
MNELAIFWLPILGGLLLGGFAVGEIYSGDKIRALWFSFFGVISFLLVLALQIQQFILKAKDDSVSENADRAYVFAVDAGISTPLGDSAPTVFVTIKNTGRTPAYDLVWRAIFMLRSFPTDGPFDLDRSKDAPKQVLPPEGSLYYQWVFTDWKPEFSASIKSGKAAVFAVGEITYKDSFGKPHFTKYRLIHGGDAMLAEGKLGAAKEGNEAD